MTFSENLMGLTDMKKIAVIVACLSAVVAGFAWGGTTTLTGAPKYNGKKLSIYVECSGEGTLDSGCGALVYGLTDGDWYYETGVCAGTGGYAAGKSSLVGGSPSGLWQGCGWRVNSDKRGAWTLQGGMDVYLTVKGGQHFGDRTIQIQPYVQATNALNTKGRITVVEPGGTTWSDTFGPLRVDGRHLGGIRTMDGRTWVGPGDNVVVRVQYPDEIMLKRGQRATLLQVDHPVIVKAVPDLKGLSVLNELGADVSGTETVAMNKLYIKNNNTAIGQERGLIRIEVAVK